MHIIWLVLWHSWWQACISTVISVVIAVCLLPLLAYCTVGMRRFIFGVCAMMSVMSTTLVALFVHKIYGDGLSAIVVAHVMINAPFALYMIYGTYERVDQLLVAVARDLGASYVQVFRTIVMPLMQPALLMASTFIFILCFSSFSVVKVLSTQPYHATYTMLIACAYKKADALLLVMSWLVRAVVVFVFTIFSMRVRTYAVQHITVFDMFVRSKRYVRYFSILFYAFALCGYQYCLGFGVYDVVDVIQGVCGVSLMRMLCNSLCIAVCSSACATICAGLLCLCMMRNGNNISSFVYAAVIALPSVVSGVMIGISMRYVAQSWPIVGIAIIVQTVMHYPIVFRILYAQLGSYNAEWQLHAYALGATRWQWVRTILLPFFASAMKRSCGMVFGLSLTDSSILSVLSDSSESTLACAVHLLRDADLWSHACAVSLFTQFIFMLILFF